MLIKIWAVGCFLICLTMWLIERARRRAADRMAKRWGLARMPGETTHDLLRRIGDRIDIN